MQAVKNWCDGERVKKLGTLRQTKQGADASLSVASFGCQDWPFPIWWCPLPTKVIDQ
jgi:hypothetical protein